MMLTKYSDFACWSSSSTLWQSWLVVLLCLALLSTKSPSWAMNFTFSALHVAAAALTT